MQKQWLGEYLDLAAVRDSYRTKRYIDDQNVWFL